MNPKEKAIDLVEKFSNIRIPNVRVRYRVSVENALIAVDEIVNANGLHPNDTDYDYNKAEQYWQQVKKELEKL